MSSRIPAQLVSPSRMKLNVVELSERDGSVSFKNLVLKSLGDLSGITLLADNVLVATYVKPRKTSGGIIMPDNTVTEDRYQGKIGLVIKIGEGAFKYVGGYKYEGTVPKIGEYVAFHTSDAREMGLNGVSVKFVPDSLVRMILPDPDICY